MTEPANECVTIVGPRSVAVVMGEVPRPAPHEVLIRTAFSGISAGTEMNVYRGTAPQWQHRQVPGSSLFVRDQPEWSYPLVYGYANVGTIEEVGAAVESLTSGMVVFTYKPHCSWVTATADEVVILPPLA